MLYPTLPVGSYSHDGWVVWITGLLIASILAFIVGHYLGRRSAQNTLQQRHASPYGAIHLQHRLTQKTS